MDKKVIILEALGVSHDTKYEDEISERLRKIGVLLPSMVDRLAGIFDFINKFYKETGMLANRRKASLNLGC
jgi:hypothetical protein